MDGWVRNKWMDNELKDGWVINTRMGYELKDGWVRNTWMGNELKDGCRDRQMSDTLSGFMNESVL